MAFRIFGFDVRVDWTFFLIAAFLGASRDARLWLIWIAVVFVSVLIHELGHAAMGQRFGLRPHIHLYAMGGLTSWSAGRRLTHGQSILVSLAGPGAGFAAGFLVLAIAPNLPRDNYLLNGLIFDLIWVNFGWGVINLLPILPLDGGNILRSSIQWVRGFPDEVTPLRVSVIVGALGVVLALLNGLLWAGLVVGWITYQNFQAMQAVSRGPA